MNSTNLEQQKQIVIRFLQQANDYADHKIKEYQSMQQETKKITWQSYKEFNEHAIRELAGEKLNHWFTTIEGQ